ncbi:MAG: 16S rRNA (cytosine(1402)-N(4))-methyltransferase RsmH [Chloroflexi bacterium]|nr:MAG: 16S rRNA (cytosine(1402)-N(4))-methyltransferase RsmH [Chloroflexota bacterium]TMC30236.1 MAG: 16S rRNA (cytosine(1402)-N(4))-methyltransferase RsmH [Chloroflexota bacterium]TMC33380.1 MAG: 16S rRNA (cytosine(1402)-N(4))-methyltransferase RsmH [Chloroflexota bacterium]TMC56090.1 MAG: 16S rRNA (cytosine(1402)-N(4))-methyltransferase RsmH [Chloroflexota bacterium]TME43400.1 MAG: 16S rRNA (cytosine(1402)-N(4))-methyltransferase RsmH [Chloroflexota bacterium]
MTSRTSGSSDERGRLHEPVLLAEVLAQLDPREDGRFLDGTVGAGGHAEAILERTAPTGRVLGLDVDPQALDEARRVLARFGDRVTLVRANFALCDVVARENGLDQVDGVLLDLGLSSIQLADAQRGFSFRAEGPLDMRADPDLRVTAGDIVNSWEGRELRRVFAEYGEEPEAGQIAAAIVRRRAREPFMTADDLGRFVHGVKKQRSRSVDAATRVFQSLRIAVNGELDNLQRGLDAALRILHPGGRLAVISFHSLEDRLVKQFFLRESRDCICPPHLPTCVCGHRAGLRVVTRRPLRADSAEAARNPRARSAVLRVVEKIAS